MRQFDELFCEIDRFQGFARRLLHSTVKQKSGTDADRTNPVPQCKCIAFISQQEIGLSVRRMLYKVPFVFDNQAGAAYFADGG